MSDAPFEARLRNARVGAVDVLKVKAFYEQAFGMAEFIRYDRPGLFEVVLNFGRTADEARAHAGTRVLVIKVDPDTLPDPNSHLIFTVSDMDAALKRVADAGGTVEWGPREPRASGLLLAMVQDPEANRVELVFDLKR